MLDQVNECRCIARCDRCDLASPRMHVATRDAATQILATAGWLVQDECVLCPRCRARRLVRPTPGAHLLHRRPQLRSPPTRP